MKLLDKVAVITGAGSGIGRGLALARRSCHLALADIDPNRLAETARLAETLSVRASQLPLDVADRAAVATLPATLLAAHSQVDVLINNAGVALSGPFEQVSETDFDWLMTINFHGVVRLTRAFLPLVRRREAARLMYLSSIYGLIAPPGQAAYLASRFTVRGFAHTLRHELASSPVGVTVVHPGGVATAIARSARLPAGSDPAQVARDCTRMNKLLRMPPDKGGELIVKGIKQDRTRILVGTDARLAALLERLLPVRYMSVLQKLVCR